MSFMCNLLPYFTSLLATAAAVASQTNSTFPNWVPVGMTGVVVLLLMKFFPLMLDKMEERNKAHEATIKYIVDRHDEREERWQDIINEKKTLS